MVGGQWLEPEGFERVSEIFKGLWSEICSRQMFLTLVEARGLDDLQQAKETTACKKPWVKLKPY